MINLTYRSVAKDAVVIADQARLRRDLQLMHRGDDNTVDLRILTSRRLDLTADRTGDQQDAGQMLEYFPALERAFDYEISKAPGALDGRSDPGRPATNREEQARDLTEEVQCPQLRPGCGHRDRGR